MTIEQLVGDALRAADTYEPSPDLFAKVQRSIDDDAAHRRRVRRALTWVGIGLMVTAVYLLATVDVVDGTVSMSFTALEVLTTVVMILIVVLVGPAIRRFGEHYEKDAFGSDPEVGAHVLRLLDLAYYLIFGAFIVITLVFDPALVFEERFAVLRDGWLAVWIRGELVRVAGLLLLMGLLHVALLVALPIAGLVHSANERRRRIMAGAVSGDALADRVDRTITVAAWVVALLVTVVLLFAVFLLVVGGISG